MTRLFTLVVLVAACTGERSDATAGTDNPGAPAAPQAEAADTSDGDRDLLTLAAGATLVSASSSPNRALDLLNGDRGDRAWTQARVADGPPFTFVFELLAPTSLTHVGIDNSRDQPSPSDVTARLFRVEASAQGPSAGYRDVGNVVADDDGEALIEVAPGEPVRWLRYTLLEGQGDGEAWIYFDEVVAYGEQEPVADDGRFTGVFETPGRSYVELRQDGATITGCYTGTSALGGGSLLGHVENGVTRVRWVDGANAEVNGTALFVIDSRGHLAGVQYRLPGRSPWSGPPAPAGSSTPCSTVEPPGNPIAEALQNTGEVTLYGIHFDFDEATLRPESEPVLRQLLEALQAGPTTAVTVEGHTDAMGAEEYNHDLSQRRAQAVVDWLVAAGLDRSRLTPVGRGEAVPLADNATADGRALNRRVEVIRR
jgi:outer membrane protein OmpA-like peptidoglycan-associated protein